MRLKCPNCDAQYEVGDGVIPPEGRDVQCSNCGNTWFQYPDGHDDRPEENVASPPQAPEPTVEVTPEPAPDEDEAEFEAALQAALGTDDMDNASGTEHAEDAEVVTDTLEDTVADFIEDAEQDPVAPAPKRALDEGVTDVLREEAELELQQRRHENRHELETQPDLGLEEAAAPAESRNSAASAARARMARRKGGGGASRNMLPDIEEINSSLRATSERTRDADAPVSDDVEDVRSQRGGFRVGFILILTVAVLCVVVYLNAAQIVDRFPKAEPYVKLFVKTVNQLRLGLDVLIQRLISTVQTLVS